MGTMPVVSRNPIQSISQKEFSDIAYVVMATAFEVHRDLGRLFDEKIYQREIAGRLGNAEAEFPIELRFDTFSKTYFLDLVIDSKAIFELKAAETIASRHRAQLLHYLFLADAHHGKLINLRPDKVEHEFINTSLTHFDRTSFRVDGCAWDDREIPGLKEWIISFLRDIGVGLDLSLYEEAAAHFCEPNSLVIPLDIRNDQGRVIGNQNVRLLTPDMAVQFSGFSPDYLEHFELHLNRFLKHTSLRAIQWINLSRSQVQFKTIHQ
jgi:GxxExxY protein